jgi:hypothetical protein
MSNTIDSQLVISHTDLLEVLQNICDAARGDQINMNKADIEFQAALVEAAGVAIAKTRRNSNSVAANHSPAGRRKRLRHSHLFHTQCG